VECEADEEAVADEVRGDGIASVDKGDADAQVHGDGGRVPFPSERRRHLRECERERQASRASARAVSTASKQAALRPCPSAARRAPAGGRNQEEEEELPLPTTTMVVSSAAATTPSNRVTCCSVADETRTSVILCGLQSNAGEDETKERRT
jgi:hypothetical protein